MSCCSNKPDENKSGESSGCGCGCGGPGAIKKRLIAIAILVIILVALIFFSKSAEKNPHENLPEVPPASAAQNLPAPPQQ